MLLFLRSVLSFISVLLAHHKLPESLHPTNVLTSTDIVPYQFPFRSYLLKLLLIANHDPQINIFEFLLKRGEKLVHTNVIITVNV